MSQSGRISFAIAVNTARDAVRRRVRFFIATAILCLTLAALAHFLGRRVYLAEFYELVVGLATDLGNERPFKPDVFRLRTFKVSAAAHLSYETESLRSPSKSANERGRTLVLPALHLNSRSCRHD